MSDKILKDLSGLGVNITPPKVKIDYDMPLIINNLKNANIQFLPTQKLLINKKISGLTFKFSN